MAELAGGLATDASVGELLSDPAVSDVCVNGSGEIWVDRGEGMRLAPNRLGGPGAVRDLAIRLARAAGRRIDLAQPFVDAGLPGGIRLHAVLPPIAPDGPLISLRRIRRASLDLEELVRLGSVHPAAETVLRAVVAGRLNVLVSGGAGTGKTTLLSALLSVADPVERIVIVEDVSELNPQLPHVVRLEARAANADGAGAVGIHELIRQALRMRPDRLVVGECRGREAADFLAALNTGQHGGGGTLHANSAADVPARFEGLLALAGLERTAAHAQLRSAIDVCAHLDRDRGRRMLRQVSVLVRDGRGLSRMAPAYEVRDGEFAAGPAAGQLRRILAGHLP